MALRRIHDPILVGRCRVDIYRDAEWNEFVVKTKAPTARLRGEYRTDDKQDARSTAAAQVRFLRKNRKAC